MNKHPVFEAILQRRSIRKFTDDAVSREHVLEILEAGRWAPSGKNNQPCRFLAIFSGDKRQQALAACTKYDAIVKNASVLIIVLLEKEKMYSPVKDHQSAGACIQNMLLATHALGLGAVWLGEIINQADQMMDVLKLAPQTFEPMAVLAIGHPATKGASSRLDITDYLLEDI